MSRIHGPVRTYRNGSMNSRPGDVTITDKQGTRVVKVNGTSLPTFEEYTYREDDSGIGGTPSTFDIASVLLAVETNMGLRGDPETAKALALVEPVGGMQSTFGHPHLAQKAAKALAMTIGTPATVVKADGRWMVQAMPRTGV